MRTLLAISARIAWLPLLCLLSCSSSSSNPGLVGSIGPTTTTPGTTATVLQTSGQTAQVASQLAQTRELLFTSTQLLKDLGDIALTVMTPAQANQNTDIACADGGTFQYSGTYDAVSSNLTYSFNGCRDKGYQYVGTCTLSGSPSNFTITLGGTSPFNIFNFNSSYTVLLAYLKANLIFNMVGSGNQDDAVYSITSNGGIVTFDYFLLDTFTMMFNRLKADYALSTNSVTRDQTISITSNTSNGQFREMWGSSYMVGLKLTDFRIDKVQHFDVNSGSFYADSTSLSGTVAFSVRPSTFGFGGTFIVSTQAPIRTVYASPRHTTQGAITLNTNATVTYNAGSDLDVSVAGDAPLHYAKEYDLMKLSDFAAMEQDKPPLITPPGAGAPISLPTGSTMTVTLTWTGPAPSYNSHSDMDLHVNYYNITAPDATTALTWNIYYDSGKTCTDPRGIEFGKAGSDLNGDGVCDIGLDLDDVDGFGPEHITDVKILPGYYVISVDSYVLNGDAAAELYLSVNIGDSIFGPYSGTLSDFDGNNSIPTAWMRVADVRVNADGSIDVLAPDGSLSPY